MAVDPNAGAPGLTPGQIYNIGKQYFESARSFYRDVTGAEPSPKETRILKDAGYRYVEGTGKNPAGRGWFDPSGARISADEAAKRADWLKRQVASGGVTIPTQRDIREAQQREAREAKQAERVKREQREQRDRVNPKRPQGRVGRIIDAATAVLVGSGAIEVIRNPPTIPKRPPPPPRDPGMGGPGELDVPGLPSPWPSSPPIARQPSPGPTKQPAKQPEPWEPLLLPVPVYSSPVPVPAPVPTTPRAPAALPGGAPATGAGTSTPPLWRQALPFLLPIALSALTLPGKGRRRRRDPLTLDQSYPLPSLTPSLADYPLLSYYGGGGSSPTNTCQCPPKGPKKRRRRRTVCYSGTYTEKASGLRKLKKRKVPCR